MSLKSYLPIIAVLALVGTVGSYAFQVSVADDPLFSALQEQAIDARFRDFILENPEVIIEAFQILEEEQTLAEEKRVSEQLTARRDDLLNDPASPVGWNADGDVTVIEFFDYQCPYCKAVVERLAELKAEDSNIRYVYKEYPILGPVSEVASRAALAAAKQGRYEPFHQALITAPGRLKEADIFKFAEKVGLDIDQLKTDMNSPEITESLAQTRQLAEDLGITGTPAFVVDDNLIPGAASLDQLRSSIEQARERSTRSSDVAHNLGDTTPK